MIDSRTDRTGWIPAWTEAGIVILFWLLIAVLSVARTGFDPRSDAGLLEGEVLHTFLEYGFWALVTPLLVWMGGRLARRRQAWPRLLLMYLVSGIAVAVVADLIDHLLWNALVVGGPPRPVSISYIVSGFHFLPEFSPYVLLLVVGFTRATVIRLQENEREAARLQANLAEARLQTLRMQINPHFLFNTLHVISDNFEENPPAARSMIARLSEILRYTFRETSPREVPLSQELGFLERYLDIQRFRFEDRLVVEKDIAEDVGTALVPNLILQPIVENAVKHGVSRVEGVGRIELRAWRDDEVLHMSVRDNGPGIDPGSGDGAAAPSEGIGLRNTRERLERTYGNAHRFTFISPPEGGVLVEICIPHVTESDGSPQTPRKEMVSSP